ncbi:protein mono-ADP-ribosyltransferase PARP4 [Entelurus aequoreus]|uniref:protein mono-ADP-ribosyltransferase PARP4 n=1 Tax=Entelurus aequoreus TaxID=161455 RepID=UPI002B1DDB32|nr:protein mono-ADP-ribosyltransferase PARP4 [Entelurus aequoreus]
MAVFDECSVLLVLKDLPCKEKRSVRSLVTENGGQICFAVNKQCSFVVVSDVSHLSASRLRSVQKFHTPVVGVDYLHMCVKKGVLLRNHDYQMDTSSPSSSHSPALTLPVQPFNNQAFAAGRAVAKPPPGESSPPEKSEDILGKFRVYTDRDKDLPAYPEDFSVAKYSIFQKNDSSIWCVLELQSAKRDKGPRFRVVRYRKHGKAVQKDMLLFLSTSEEAVEVYRTLTESLSTCSMQPRTDIPAQAQDLGSGPLRQLLLEEKLSAGVLSHDVGVFVELLWTEALGCLGNILRVPVHQLSMNDVSRAEGLWIEAQRKLKKGLSAEVVALQNDFYSLLPHRMPIKNHSAKIFSQKLDLCQLIRDILNVSEMTLRSPAPSSVGKFRALRCSIETVDPGSDESRALTSLLQDSPVQIHQVLRVSRAVELQTFKGQLGNVKSLLHSSSASNFVGILSRGLLLPSVGVEFHGVDRTDAGSLGSGIYFSDSMRTCLKYSKPGATDGSRLLVVCDVALGDCLQLHHRDPTLTQAPEGHDSVRATCCTSSVFSEFEDDEYVVYKPEQVKLKYVVRFSVVGEQVKAFSPAVDTSSETPLPPAVPEVLGSNVDIGNIRSPLEVVTAGLLDSSGRQLPLQAIHVKCKLVDLLSQVVIFQKYTNHGSTAIEAKYVFPLDDCAAVCAFEAFIDGKHVVGQVKEKEKARREYKQAIEEGHGAYLMDQDAPNVFTISVGNLPAGATVLIKVTFVSELIIKDGALLFSLPGSVAPWQESAALNQTTQVTLDKVRVTAESASGREFSLDMSMEMPNKISSLSCITHKVKTKRTDCKAVVSVLPGQVLGPDGFQLSVILSEVHLPRMWVERHPDFDSQACMLVFYPKFDVKASCGSDEVVILLDVSESMLGEPIRWSRAVALHVIKTLQPHFKINIVLFSTDHTQAFLTAQPLDEARQAAEKFIHTVSPAGGSTELWRPLRALSLLPPSRGTRNLLLLSDGHVQNAGATLQFLRDEVAHSRLFACGFSPTANQHMLRALAQAGGGAYEYFDSKSKHKWAAQVACQLRRMESPGCRSVSVKWHQYSPTATPPVQAPMQLNALFNDCHTLVYGFVAHCTQATLLGDLSGQELRTMVSTSELQKTSGTFLHKLTARALIRDYEDGSLDSNQAEHEGKKSQWKPFIIALSKEFCILSQFTSFVAIEEREPDQERKAVTDVSKLLAEEDVDILPYISWMSRQSSEHEELEDSDSSESDLDMGFGLFSPLETKSSESGSDRDCRRFSSLKPESSESGPYRDCFRFSLEGPAKRSHKKEFLSSPLEPESSESGSDKDDVLFSRLETESSESGSDRDIRMYSLSEPEGPLLADTDVRCCFMERDIQQRQSEASLPTGAIEENVDQLPIGMPPPPPPIHAPSDAPPPPPLLKKRRQDLSMLGSSARPALPHNVASPPETGTLFRRSLDVIQSPGFAAQSSTPPIGCVKYEAMFSRDVIQSPDVAAQSSTPPIGCVKYKTMFSRDLIQSPDVVAQSSTPPIECDEDKESFPQSKKLKSRSKTMSPNQFYFGVQDASDLVVGEKGAPPLPLPPIHPSSDATPPPRPPPLRGMSKNVFRSGFARSCSVASTPETGTLFGSSHDAFQTSGFLAQSSLIPCGTYEGFSQQSRQLKNQLEAMSTNRLDYSSPVGFSCERSRFEGKSWHPPSTTKMKTIKSKQITITPHLSFQAPFLADTDGFCGFMERDIQKRQSGAVSPFRFRGPERGNVNQPRISMFSAPPPICPSFQGSLPTGANRANIDQLPIGMPPPPPPIHPSSDAPPPQPRPRFRTRHQYVDASSSPLLVANIQQPLQQQEWQRRRRGQPLQQQQQQPPQQQQQQKGGKVDKMSMPFSGFGFLQPAASGGFESCSEKQLPTEDKDFLSEEWSLPARSAPSTEVASPPAIGTLVGGWIDVMQDSGLDEDSPTPLILCSSQAESLPELGQQKMISIELAKSSPVDFSSGGQEALDIVLEETPRQFSRPKVSAGGQPVLLKWPRLFKMQHADGYWDVTAKLGECVGVDLDVLTNDFLRSKGIRSLGVTAHADILKLLATLLVLQLMRLEKLPEGLLLRTLFTLEEPPSRSAWPRWQLVKKAVDWVRWADRQYPCICSRLEMALTWESATRQLLGYDVLPAFSPLAGLPLRRNFAAPCPPVVVH